MRDLRCPKLYKTQRGEYKLPAKNRLQNKRPFASRSIDDLTAEVPKNRAFSSSLPPWGIVEYTRIVLLAMDRKASAQWTPDAVGLLFGPSRADSVLTRCVFSVCV